MYKCDVCKKEVGYTETIKSEYSTGGIKKACDSCSKTLNAHLWELRRLSWNAEEHWFKIFLRSLTKKNRKKKEKTKWYSKIMKLFG